MKKVVSLIVILFISIINAAAQDNSNTQKRSESDEYSVYKTVLKALFIKPNTKQIIIRKLTSGTSFGGNLIGESDATFLLSPGRENTPVELITIENYNALNQEPVELKNDFDINTQVNLVTEAELTPTIEKLRLDETTEDYRNAVKDKNEITTIIRLSRVGFNKSKNQALIHVEYMCGSLCGEGKYIILSKKNDGWIINRDVRTWIS